jgi:hypothetical protein
MDHFERLLEETCPNHSYPVKHKLRMLPDEEFHDHEIPILRHGTR